MATKQRQTEEKIKDNTDQTPGNSSNESSKNDAGHHQPQINGNSINDEVKASGETEPQTLCGNNEKQGQNTPIIDTSVDNHTGVGASQANTETEPAGCGNTVEQGQQVDSPEIKTDTPETTNQPQINGNSINDEVKASGETEPQTLCGNTEKQGQNTPIIDTSVDNHTGVDASQAKTETEPAGRGNTVEQGQPGSKSDQILQEKRNGGDSKSNNKKTSRFSDVFGCWRDELIVVSLVMTIVALVFLLFVCFHYERKIDNMNIELNKFKTELTIIRAEVKKPNPAIGTDTCLQNDDNLRDLNTKIDNIATKMNDTIKNLGDKMLTEIQNISTVMTKTISVVRENDTQLSNELTCLNASFNSFKTNATQNYDSLKSSVDVVNETIKRNITEKVESFYQQLGILQTAKEKAEYIISQLEKDVDKIFPNTFNKGALITAFVIVIVFVLALYVYVFLFLRTTSGVGRTGQTINYNSVLSQIPDNCVLNNSICIVSFDEQRSTIHKRLVTPACQGRETNIFVVRSHESLLGMPRCRLYIMCAEFSERHVIIEQPNLGLGDLKRCTHDAVRKIGGELVILYTRDPGSRRLADGQMFNRDIYCVNDQPELCALRDRGRFISLYDSLTPSQTQKLTETVNECLQ